MPGYLSGVTSWPRKARDWLCADRKDYRQFKKRKNSPAYRSRLRWCKTLWIGTGLLMIINPSINLFIVLVLIATFLSFAVLDEASGSQVD